MVVYHVTTTKKLRKYITTGAILPPVRAWISIAAAERFSKQTGRRLILRLKADGWVAYKGHRGEAVVSDAPYILRDT
jgi:hypothetical protein